MQLEASSEVKRLDKHKRMEFVLRESDDNLSEGEEEGKSHEQENHGRSEFRNSHDQEDRGLPSRVVMQHAPSARTNTPRSENSLPSHTTQKDTANISNSRSSSRIGDSDTFVSYK